MKALATFTAFFLYNQQQNISQIMTSFIEHTVMCDLGALFQKKKKNNEKISKIAKII